jgi:hypothetical protein
VSETRPGELGRIDRLRIAQETADLLKIADNQQQYREHVLTSLVRMEVKLDGLQTSFVEHVKEDDQRFGAVTQSIGGAISLKTVGMAVAVATSIAGAIAFVVWIVSLVTKS